jgi:hypothetical protein
MLLPQEEGTDREGIEIICPCTFVVYHYHGWREMMGAIRRCQGWVGAGGSGVTCRRHCPRFACVSGVHEWPSLSFECVVAPRDGDGWKEQRRKALCGL